jgi:histidine triad (HIT) family protein
MRRLLLRLARSPAGGLITGFLFAHMSFVIPVKRLRETATLIAFYHPRPAYPVHILLVPRRKLRSMAQLSAADTDFLQELFQVVNELVLEMGLEPAGYRLIANGGAYQEVDHLHFHLVAGEMTGDRRPKTGVE